MKLLNEILRTSFFDLDNTLWTLNVIRRETFNELFHEYKLESLGVHLNSFSRNTKKEMPWCGMNTVMELLTKRLTWQTVRTHILGSGIGFHNSSERIAIGISAIEPQVEDPPFPHTHENTCILKIRNTLCTLSRMALWKHRKSNWCFWPDKNISPK